MFLVRLSIKEDKEDYKRTQDGLELFNGEEEKRLEQTQMLGFERLIRGQGGLEIKVLICHVVDSARVYFPCRVE